MQNSDKIRSYLGFAARAAGRGHASVAAALALAPVWQVLSEGLWADPLPFEAIWPWLGWLIASLAWPPRAGWQASGPWGFALAAWSLPALSFAVWTFANLAPRAHNHHTWYRERFADYPRDRKAVIPFLW